LKRDALFLIFAGAHWRRFALAAAMIAAYGGWLVFGDSPLSRARAATGALPEFSFGFHGGATAARLAELGARRSDYLWLQAFDLPMAALPAMMAMLGLALAARKRRGPFASVRWLMVAPIVFAVTDLIENSLLAAFASGAITPAAALALLQQAATTTKLCLAAGCAFMILSAAFAPGPPPPAERLSS
jgi:hypothetical protein